MVTERIILAIAAALYGKACTTKRTIDGSGPDEQSNPHASRSQHEHASSAQALYDDLLLSFDVGEIQSAIHWMKLRGFISAFGFGIIAPEMGYQLTEKGIRYAESKVMPEEDSRRLSGKALSVKPGMYGITLDPKELWWRIKKRFFAWTGV